MKLKARGFTIVELLIVIVVIGILASIVIVAYTGVRDKADNAARVSELKAWENVFEIYKASNGHYPGTEDPALHFADDPNPDDDLGYCLGKDFPASDSSSPDGYCRSPYGGHLQYKPSSYINNDVTTISSLPSGPHNTVKNTDTNGPFVRYYKDGDDTTTWVLLTDIFNGYECPSGTVFNYKFDGQNAVLCEIRLNKSD